MNYFLPRSSNWNTLRKSATTIIPVSAGPASASTLPLGHSTGFGITRPSLTIHTVSRISSLLGGWISLSWRGLTLLCPCGLGADNLARDMQSLGVSSKISKVYRARTITRSSFFNDPFRLFFFSPKRCGFSLAVPTALSLMLVQRFQRPGASLLMG